MSAEYAMLCAGAAELGLVLEEMQLAQLLQFLKLIQKWNKAYNLSGVRDSAAMVRLHLLDSLAVLPHLNPGCMLDVGTGAGLPGIPLAIASPGSEWVLLDSNAKKTRFVQQAIVELKLPKASVVQARVEAYQPGRGFDAIITRAFASLPEIQRVTQHLLAPGGVLWAMKGKAETELLQGVSGQLSVIPLRVPGIAAERCLIRITN